MPRKILKFFNFPLFFNFSTSASSVHWYCRKKDLKHNFPLLDFFISPRLLNGGGGIEYLSLSNILKFRQDIEPWMRNNNNIFSFCIYISIQIFHNISTEIDGKANLLREDWSSRSNYNLYFLFLYIVYISCTSILVPTKCLH